MKTDILEIKYSTEEINLNTVCLADEEGIVSHEVLHVAKPANEDTDGIPRRVGYEFFNGTNGYESFVMYHTLFPDDDKETMTRLSSNDGATMFYTKMPKQDDEAYAVFGAGQKTATVLKTTHTTDNISVFVKPGDDSKKVMGTYAVVYRDGNYTLYHSYTPRDVSKQEHIYVVGLTNFDNVAEYVYLIYFKSSKFKPLGKAKRFVIISEKKLAKALGVHYENGYLDRGVLTSILNNNEGHLEYDLSEGPSLVLQDSEGSRTKTINLTEYEI